MFSGRVLHEPFWLHEAPSHLTSKLSLIDVMTSLIIWQNPLILQFKRLWQIVSTDAVSSVRAYVYIRLLKLNYVQSVC